MCKHLGDLNLPHGLYLLGYLIECKVKSMMRHVYMKFLHASGMRMNVYPCICYACGKAF